MQNLFKYGSFVILILSASMYMYADDNIDLNEDKLKGSLLGGSAFSLRWVSSRNKENKVDCYFSKDDGKTFDLISKNTSDAIGAFYWKVPKIDSNSCRFRLILKDKNGVELSRFNSLKSFSIDSTDPTATISGPKMVTSKDQVPFIYKVSDNKGGSGIKSATLFYRLDGSSNNWIRSKFSLAEDDVKSNAPMYADFSHRGTWNVYLRVVDNAGNSNEFPSKLTKNYFNINVNSGEPMVHFLPMKRNNVFGKNGKMTIRWKAEDENLLSGAISLHYYMNGKWVSFATSLKNTGTYLWSLPNKDFKTSRIKITAEDETSKTTSVELTTLIKVDVTPPDSYIRDERKQSFKKGLWTNANRKLRLTHRSDDFGGVGVEKLILHWRKVGASKKWNVTPLKLYSIYDKFEFNQPDGNYELTLTGVDKVGNAEAYPKESDRAEFLVKINVSQHSLNFTSVKKVGDNIVVKWKAKSASFSKNQQVQIKLNGVYFAKTDLMDYSYSFPVKNRTRFSIQMYTMTLSKIRVETSIYNWESSSTTLNDDVLAFSPGQNTKLHPSNRSVIFKIKNSSNARKISVTQSLDGRAFGNALLLNAGTKSFDLKAPNVSTTSWHVKISSSIKSDTLRLKVDSTAPTAKVYFRGGQRHFLNDQLITYVQEIDASGGASVKSSQVFFKSPRSSKWTLLPSKSLRLNELGVYLFTATIQDEFDRGILIPEEGDVTTVNVSNAVVTDTGVIRSGLIFVSSDLVKKSNIVFDKTYEVKRPVFVKPVRKVVPEPPVIIDDNKVVKTIKKAPPKPPSILPYSFSTYLNAAKDSASENEYSKAALYLESAHRKRNDVAESHYLLAKMYIQLHRQDKDIVKQLNLTVKFDATNAKAWHYLGVFASRQHDNELAREYYLKAQDVMILPETLHNVAKLDYADGKVVQARNNFLKVIEMLNSKTDSALYKDAVWKIALIHTYSSLKNVKKARQNWANVINIFGRDTLEAKSALKWMRENN